jgi:hypothetical protein
MPVDDYDGLDGFGFVDLSQPLTPTASSPACTLAGGSVTAAFPPVPYDYFLSVEQISVSCTSTFSTVAKVYIDTPAQDINVIAATLQGNLDQDDVNSPIIILPTKFLYVVWTNCSIGAVGSVRLQQKAKALSPLRKR